MKKSIKAHQTDYWKILPLLLSSGFGLLVLIVSKPFAISGLVTAGVLIVLTVGLYFWSRKRYRLSLQAIEQKLSVKFQQENDEIIQSLQNSHKEAILQAGINQIATERQHIKVQLTGLFQNFDRLFELHGGRNQEKIEILPISVETEIAGLAQRCKALTMYFDELSTEVENKDSGVGRLDSLCQKVLPIWASQVDMARVHSEESIADLAEHFGTLVNGQLN
jgi:hypothetical protein